MKNKIFKIIPKSAGYVENDEVVVISETKEEALSIIESEKVFDKHQYPLAIEEVNLNEKGIVLISNTGS